MRGFDFSRMDAQLASFTVDSTPYFTRTVLTASPVLLSLHLESGNAVPLPHVSVGVNAKPLSPQKSMVRRASSSGEPIKDLPESLHQLMRDHKPETQSLFLRWENSGQREVPLNAFAEGVRQITGVPLPEDDLVSVLECVEPKHGNNVAGDPRWRSRRLDANRLWRLLQNTAGKAASNYIKQARRNSLSPTHKGPSLVKPAGGSWALRSEIPIPRLPAKESSFATLLAERESERAVASVVRAGPAALNSAGTDTLKPAPTGGAAVPAAEPDSVGGATSPRPAAHWQLKEALGTRLSAISDLFVQWDYDGDGLVDRAEFREAVSVLGLQFDQAVVDSVFDSYDTDGSGAISYGEYLRYTLRDAVGRSLLRVVDVFKTWDDDESGQVSKKEFRTALRQLGFDAPREVFDELFDELDRDGNGTIEYKELHAALRQGASVKLKAELQPGARGKIQTAAMNRLPTRK